MKKVITILLFSLIFANAYSNNSNSFLFLKKGIAEITDTTVECIVVISSKIIYKGAELSGLSDSYVKIFGLSDSSVKILKGEVSVEIPINDIKSIKFKGKGFWKGAAIGSGIGFVLGFLAGASLTAALDDGGESPDIIGPGIKGGFIFALPFGLIGGGLGSSFAEDKFYDLSKLDFKAKRKKVKYLIKEYSDR